MSRFNIVEIEEYCFNCKKKGVFEVQFKFGNLDLSRYRVGDKIRWGKNSVGNAGASRVVVDGVLSSACIHCGYNDERDENDDYYVFFETDVLIETKKADGSYSFIKNNFFELS